MMFLLLALLACNNDRDGDGILDEFDCDVDDAAVGLELALYTDGDGDGYGAGDVVWSCEVTAGLVAVYGDCDDADATVHPDADELCDGVDNDCSGSVDEAAVDEITLYLDHDGDGFGDPDWSLQACDGIPGYVALADDCDDADAAINPDAEEVCNGVDDDCDGAMDDATATDALTWYADTDGDDHGDAAVMVMSCEAPEGYVALSDDCDDGDADAHPTHDELCDNKDNNCDDIVDHDGWLPGDYDSLDDVMENAPDGAHVCIAAGAWPGSGYDRDGSITLQGQGSDATTLDAQHDQFVYMSSGDLGLLDLEVTDAWARDDYGYGGVAQMEGEGQHVLLQRARLTDGGCDTTYYCYGGVVYFDDTGSLRIQDVEVDGFFYESTYEYGHLSGLFYTSYTDVDIDGLEVHDSDVSGRYVYSLSVYHDYGELDVDGLWVHDNNVDVQYNFGLALYVDEAYGTVRLRNITVEDNTVHATRYGYLLGLYLDDVYGGSDVYNLEIVRNTVDVDEYGYIYGLAGYTYYGTHDWQNVLVADNVVTATSGDVYAGLVEVEYGGMTLTNADFVNNSFVGFDDVYGGATYTYYANLDIRNTNIVGNDFGSAEVYGVHYIDGGGFDADYNNLYATTPTLPWVYDDNTGVQDDQPTYTVDPGYSDVANGIYTLGPGSPLIDAGDPQILDADGSVSDVGAYGGPYGASW